MPWLLIHTLVLSLFPLLVDLGHQMAQDRHKMERIGCSEEGGTGKRTEEYKKTTNRGHETITGCYSCYTSCDCFIYCSSSSREVLGCKFKYLTVSEKLWNSGKKKHFKKMRIWHFFRSIFKERLLAWLGNTVDFKTRRKHQSKLLYNTGDTAHKYSIQSQLVAWLEQFIYYIHYRKDFVQSDTIFYKKNACDLFTRIDNALGGSVLSVI